MGALIRRGGVWWTGLPAPGEAEPDLRRPVVVVQADAFDDRLASTVVVLPLASDLAHAGRPGVVPLEPRATGLPRDVIVRADQPIPVAKASLAARAGRWTAGALAQVDAAIDLVLGRSRAVDTTGPARGGSFPGTRASRRYPLGGPSRASVVELADTRDLGSRFRREAD